MAVVVNGKVYVGGLYVGSVEESKRKINDGVVDVDYDRKKIYVIKEVY